MKYLKIEAFEKHLEEALPDHPSSIYMILLAEPDEREHIVKKILTGLGKVEQEKLELKDLEEAIASPSFFSSKRCLIVEGVESEKAAAFDKVLPFLQSLPQDLTVILSGSGFKAKPTFYEALKKEMIFLDLSKEPPWERKKRWQKWLLDAMRQERKTLAPDAASYLMEANYPSFAVLLQEVTKAATYVGEAKTISLEAIKAICHFDQSEKGWDLAEAIVWGGQISIHTLRQYDTNEAMGLLGQLRYHIKLGLCLAEQNEEIITKAYPKLRPKSLEKYKPLASRLPPSYFRLALDALFDTELKCRSGLKAPILLETLTYKLSQKRKRAALPST